MTIGRVAWPYDILYPSLPLTLTQAYPPGFGPAKVCTRPQLFLSGLPLGLTSRQLQLAPPGSPFRVYPRLAPWIYYTPSGSSHLPCRPQPPPAPGQSWSCRLARPFAPDCWYACAGSLPYFSWCFSLPPPPPPPPPPPLPRPPPPPPPPPPSSSYSYST